jgi:hypothetical protein
MDSLDFHALGVFAKDFNVYAAPCGSAWRNSRDAEAQDNAHPNQWGSVDLAMAFLHPIKPPGATSTNVIDMAVLLAQKSAQVSLNNTFTGNNNVINNLTAGNEFTNLGQAYFQNYLFTDLSGSSGLHENGSGYPTIAVNGNDNQLTVSPGLVTIPTNLSAARITAGTEFTNLGQAYFQNYLFTDLLGSSGLHENGSGYPTIAVNGNDNQFMVAHNLVTMAGDAMLGANSGVIAGNGAYLISQASATLMQIGSGAGWTTGIQFAPGGATNALVTSAGLFENNLIQANGGLATLTAVANTSPSIANGFTNASAYNETLMGFTGTSVTLWYLGGSKSLGTIVTPTQVCLQPGEGLQGGSCAAIIITGGH